MIIINCPTSLTVCLYLNKLSAHKEKLKRTMDFVQTCICDSRQCRHIVNFSFSTVVVCDGVVLPKDTLYPDLTYTHFIRSALEAMEQQALKYFPPDSTKHIEVSLTIKLPLPDTDPNGYGEESITALVEHF